MGNEIFTISLIGLYGAFKFAMTVFAITAAVEVIRQEANDEERDWASVVSSGRTGVLLSVPGVGLMRAGLYGKMLLAGAGGYITGQGAVNTYESGKHNGWGDKRTLFSGGLTALGAFGTYYLGKNIIFGKGGFVRNYKAAKLNQARIAENNAPGFKTRRINSAYIGEQYKGNNVFRGTHVKYLNELEREAYKVTFKDGKVYKANGELLDTTGFKSLHGQKNAGIFVMDKEGNIYVGQHSRGLFHHSSFLSGGRVASAGEIVAKNGIIETISSKSGHYQPRELHQIQFKAQLKAFGIDTSSINFIKGF